MPKILLAGQDMHLLATRAAVLQRLGCQVQWGSSARIESVLREEQVDIVVLCHTLSLKERTELNSLAHAGWSTTRVLQLVSIFWEEGHEILDGTRVSICEPHQLIREVQELLRESTRRQSKPGPVSICSPQQRPKLVQQNVGR
ncbi:hypothetical protein JAO29_08245 [Edaphobacter sp. HDX4]|uniref:hypothetical protein n=1 Tax=Edaphobacter sp. HDX4 TaxID=2794064 RepID=UPI002FE6BEC3